MQRHKIRILATAVFLGLWGCSQNHPTDPQPTPAPAPVPAPIPVPTATPLADLLLNQLGSLDPRNEDDNRGYVQLLCEHQSELPNQGIVYRFVLRSLLNKIDLSRLLVEKDCSYLVSELFKSKRSMDRLEIRYGPDSADWDLLQQLNTQSDFTLLKHLKRFIRNLRLVADENSDTAPPFLEKMFHESGSFCSIELWTIPLKGDLELQFEPFAACATRLTLMQTKLLPSSRLQITAPQGLAGARIQIQGLLSPLAVLERLTVEPLQNLNAFNFVDESAQPLFKGANLNPFLMTSLSGLEHYSDFSNRRFKPIDPPYLNLGDSAISDFSAVEPIFTSQYLAFIRNNLPAADAADRTRTCNSLMRFKAIKYQPSWYTQQNWNALAADQQTQFRTLAAVYERSCQTVRDAVVRHLQNDEAVISICGSIELKSFNCKLAGVEFEI